mgnify:CR=1 FL=1
MDLTQFSKITGLVVDELEGGYFHPNMLLDGRVKDDRYSNSGETMFGIDRAQGGTINTSEAGQQFWQLIDSAGAADNWRWNYKGGEIAGQLKDLAAQMMYPVYISLEKAYLSSDARAIVDSSKKLTFHFCYAAWNGAGWFKKFATAINEAVANGTTDENSLVDIAIDSRVNSGNSLIQQGGNKFSDIFSNPYFVTGGSIIAALVFFFVIFLIYKNTK